MKIHIIKLLKLYLVTCFVLILSMRLAAEAPTVTLNTKVLAHFDDSTTLALDHGSSTTITTYGDPQIIGDGKHGKCLQLDSNDYISFSGSSNLGNFTEGTIMFWIRPHWDNNNGVSHTFCSMNLYNDGNDGYMAISDGWWEPGGGTDYLYAIANNQFGLAFSKEDASIPLKSGKWYHISMTFKFNGTSDSFVRMYINGSLISSDDVSSTNTPGTCSARGNFQIGSSYGILDSNLRYADADFDEFVILDKALPENEVVAEYSIQNRKQIVAHFDGSTIQLDEASSDTSITTHGNPTIISDGVIGSCLSLDTDDYISFDMEDNIGDFSEGTVMFWVRPHWTNDNGVSHTLCSMKLYNDGSDGYMAISDGWWEPAGADRFYFLSNNQFGLRNADSDANIPFIENQWYHIAMTFRFDGTENSFCNTYIDGELAYSDMLSGYNTPSSCYPRDVFQLGSSNGIIDGNMRYANADFDEFYFSSQIMLSEEIKNTYDIQSGGNLKISANFSNSIKIDTAIDPEDLTEVGTPSIVYSDILNGRALSLGSSDYLTMNSVDNIGDFSEGTVMFWVRPHWDNDLGVSHTFCSMKLYNDGADGYLSMSDGWWEPSGADRFYFIANNQFALACGEWDTALPFEENKWYHVAMTFKFNGVGNSYTKMYIDGELIVTDTTDGYNTPGTCSPRGELQLGSAYSILDSNLRYADSDFSNFRFLTKALSDTVILNTWKLGSSYRLPYRDVYTIANDPYDPPTNASGVIRESRILLDEAGGYSSKAGAEALVDKAKDGGFNIIMTCVYHGNGAKWDTTTIPVENTAYQTLIDGKEPLKYLVDYAHSQGIDVHAWFTINNCNSNMESLFITNGWVDSSFMDDGKYKVIVHYSGFRDFISDLVEEVVEDYGVDGVNLDFIRARGYCTTSYCQTDYSTKNPGRNLTTDISNKEYSYLGEWNYNAVTDIVSQVNAKCAAIDSDVVISICGRLVLDDNRLTDTYARQGRDGKRWSNAGYIDFILNMDYRMRPDYTNFRGVLTEFINGADGKTGFITTDYYYPDGTIASLDPDYTATLLSFSQRMKTGVIACYIYSMLSDDQITAIKAGPFKDAAVPYYE
jgi:Glycosyl hydrolase-like 10/Concanavalin A-like lectin/glucanases superfamily